MGVSEVMSGNQWGTFKTQRFKKPRDQWGTKNPPPIPVALIIKRIIIGMKSGRRIMRKTIYRECKKVNSKITPNMVGRQLLILEDNGELLWISRKLVMKP